jgi:hypothetical protein
MNRSQKNLQVVLLTTVLAAGQLVTVGPQEVMVTSLVEYTVDWAMTAEAMKATAAIENCILIDLI